MQIGIPAETLAGETRVAATPETVTDRCGQCDRPLSRDNNVLKDAPANSSCHTGCMCTIKEFARCVPCCRDMQNAGVEFCPTCGGSIAVWLNAAYAS